MDNTANHTRVNNILLGPLERPALKWMAAHSPKWMNPDVYTAIGMLGSLVILVGYALSRFHLGWLWLANLGFVVNWVGDSLDGTLARHRHIERPVYGFYIDHVTDAISQVMVFVGLGISPLINFNVACLALVAYLLLSILAYLRTSAVGEYKISYGRLGPTEARVLAVFLNVAMFVFGEQLWNLPHSILGTFVVNPYDLAVGAIGLLLLLFFLTTAWQESVRLVKAGR